MKVRELQERLTKVDPELEVLCYSEDARLLVEDRGFILFDISAVDTAQAECSAPAFVRHPVSYVDPCVRRYSAGVCIFSAEWGAKVL